MALKNLFDMVKADRYTADGRDELIKAQEAETEDVKYEIGQISQKTGLQKTANGWVKPKSGKAPGAKTGEGKTPNKPTANVKRNESEAVKNGDKTIYRIKGTQYYFDSPEEAENAILAENRSGKTYAKPSKDENVNNIQEALGFKLDMTSGNSMDEFIKKTGENEYAANVWSFGRDSKGTLINKLSETSSPNATIKKENGEWKLYHKDRDGKETIVTAKGRQAPTENKPAAESKPAESEHEKRVNEYFKSIRKDKLSPVSRVAAELDRGTFDDDVRETMGDDQSMEDLARTLISPAYEDKGDIPQNKLDTARKFILKRYKALESDATDAAPRVLTGDTKIRIRKA